MDWRNIVKDSREVKLFEALENPRFLWRTRKALEVETGMTPKEIEEAVKKYAFLIREGKTQSGDPIWALQDRYWKSLGVTQFLDFMSNTSTSSDR